MISKTLITIGTRPELIKLAPLISLFIQNNGRESLFIVYSNQHQLKDNPSIQKDLLAFDIKFDEILNITRNEDGLTKITADLFDAYNSLMKKCKDKKINFSCCIAQGDTTNTYVSATFAFFNQIPFYHVEAGLRTNNLYSPFPEEFFRKTISSIAQLHFAPTEYEKNNLLKEGILEEHIFVTGNTGIDTLKKQIELYEEKEQIKKAVVVSIHRRENIQQINSIIEKVFKYIIANSNWNFVWIENIGFKMEDHFTDLPQNLALSKVLSYEKMIELYLETAVLLTDSGTMQEESCYLQIPTILIRDKSERYNDVTNKITQFFNSDKTIETIIDEFNEKENIRSNTFYGNGLASQKIISILEKQLNQFSTSD